MGLSVEIEEAQDEVRAVYRGGYAGPAVSAVVWGVANAVFLWVSPAAGIAALFIGGMLIFPLSSLILRITAGPYRLPKGHPSAALATQSALTVPLGLLVAIALGILEPLLFFPASLIIVGAHYLTFISLYGMRSYGVLAGVLVAVGAIAMFLLPQLGNVSGWIGAGVFVVFSVLLYRAPETTEDAFGY